MKKNAMKLFLLLFTLPFSMAAQEAKFGSNSDTITLSVIELLDVDYRFKIILDDYIHHIPARMLSPKKAYFIYVHVDAYLTYREQVKIIDSLYQNNDFHKNIYSFPYSVYIERIRKESKRMLSISEFQQCFLYKYRGIEVFFVSPMQLKFPWVGSSASKQYIVSKKEDFYKPNFSLYTIGDFEVVKRKYSKLYSKPSGVPLKRKYYFDKEKSDLLKSKK